MFLSTESTSKKNIVIDFVSIAMVTYADVNKHF